MNKNIFWISPIIAMSLGILPMPYGYYSLLRIIVCGCSLFFVYKLLYICLSETQYHKRNGILHYIIEFPFF